MRKFLVLIIGLTLITIGINACASDSTNISAAQTASYEEAGSSVIGHQSSEDIPNVDSNPY